MTFGTPPARWKRWTRTERSRSLSRSSPEPLYRQLAQHLEARDPQRTAEAGRPAGVRRACCPSALRSAASRCARRSRSSCASRSLVRKQGKGTFVTAAGGASMICRRLHGLLGSLFSQAESASTRLLRYELAAAPADIAELLGLRARPACAAARSPLSDRRTSRSRWPRSGSRRRSPRCRAPRPISSRPKT